MRTSRSEARRRPVASAGTRARLVVLLLVVVLLLLTPAVGLTGALLTDTTQLTGVVSTRETFPPSSRS